MAFKSFLSIRGVEHDITDGMEKKTLTFYPMSMGLAYKLKEIIKPLAKSVQTFMQSDKHDTGSYHKQVINKDGGSETEIRGEPIQMELAALRQGQQSSAVESLVDALLGENNQTIFAEIVIDSLRDEFKDAKPSVQEFLRNISMPQMIQLLGGVMKANKGVFGPLEGLAGKIGAVIGDKISKEIESRTATQTQSGTTTSANFSGAKPEATA